MIEDSNSDQNLSPEMGNAMTSGCQKIETKWGKRDSNTSWACWLSYCTLEVSS